MTTKALAGLRIFVDILIGFAFFAYILGGFSLSSLGAFSYFNDLSRATLFLFLIAYSLGFKPTDFFIVRGFANIEAYIQKKKSPSLAGIVVMTSLGFLAVCFLALPLIRHTAFQSWFWDLGVMEQVIWRKAFGYGLTSTAINGQYSPPLDFLQNQHLNFWLIPIAMVYRIFPYTAFLLILQSLGLLLTMIPLWKISKILFPKKVPLILLPIFYWCWHSVHKNNIWDIHEACYLTMVSSWAYYFFLKNKYLLVCAFVLAVGLFKEDAWVLASAMGFYFLSSKGKWGLACLCLGLGLSIFFGYGMFFNKVNTLSERYGYLGNGFSDIIPTLKSNPLIFLEHLITPGPREFLLSVCLLSGGLWLFGGWAIIPILPTLFECALSSHSGMYSFNGHYVLGIGGPLFFATAQGISKIDKFSWTPKTKNIVFTIATLIAIGQLRFSESAEIKYILSSDGWKNRHCLNELVDKIPKNAPVYTQDPLASHFSKRPLFFQLEKTSENFIPQSFATVTAREELPTGFREVFNSCGFKVGYRE